MLVIRVTRKKPAKLQIILHMSKFFAIKVTKKCFFNSKTWIFDYSYVKINVF